MKFLQIIFPAFCLIISVFRHIFLHFYLKNGKNSHFILSIPHSACYNEQIPCALPRAILTHPAFWLVLLFDTVMLIVLSFTHV